MSINPRNLKPSELVRLLNSTPLGEVITQGQLTAHRDAAGLRLASDEDDSGKAKAIDLLKYAAWLFARRRRRVPEGDGQQSGYAAHKARARARQAEQSEQDRNIAPIPPVEDPERREAASSSLRIWFEQYFPATFTLAWSEDHLRLINAIEVAALRGDLRAIAMPRGSGKTQMLTRAALWALFIGARKYCAVIAAGSEHLKEIMEILQTELENNHLLLADWPEICYPIVRLEGITNRGKGQNIDGERTRTHWSDKKIVFPTVRGSAASGAVVHGTTILGRIRGMAHLRSDGETARPDLVLVDDPQTDASAASPMQNRKRERILAGAVLGLAGPGKRIAGFASCTVIERGDMADRILDRTLHPEWRGERCKMVYSFPTNVKLWDEYAVVRAEELRADGDGSAARAFYAENRAAMDEGAVVAWPQRFDPGELSGIQNAMNLKLRDEERFWAEYQNDPQVEEPDQDRLTAAHVEAKISGVPRGVVPLACHTLILSADVQKKLVYWMATAWGDGFRGHVVDHGTWPDQRKNYFTYRQASRSLARVLPGTGLGAQLLHGLEQLSLELLGREWRNEAGASVRPARFIIDANYESDVVYQFCRESPHRDMLLPAHGRGISARQKPMHQWAKSPGDQIGFHWRIPGTSKRVARYVLIDVNFWKTFVSRQFMVPRGDAGITLFAGSPSRQRMLIEHFTSEVPKVTWTEERTVEEWPLIPGRDNHEWDCLIQGAVGASMSGVKSEGHATPGTRRRKRFRGTVYHDKGVD